MFRYNNILSSRLWLSVTVLSFLFSCGTQKQLPVAVAPEPETVLVQGSPAQKLEIHHINVNNGDATIINIIHADQSERKVLIDGGQGAPGEYLVPYINSVLKDNQFEFVILSHFHNDHYNGLVGIGDGSILGKYYIDLGGYSMREFVNPLKLDLIQPKDTTSPWTSDGIFVGGFQNFLTELGKAVNTYGMQRYMPISKPADKISEMVGVVIPLDTFKMEDTDIVIKLRCVGAWGYTQGNGGVVDNWNKGASKNDPTLAFVLECGEFRYFFGGDMGGQASGSYIDQETTLAQGLNYLYQGFKSFYKPDTTFNGHLCGFKANHHGSAHSNNSTFLQSIRPAVCVTSAGGNTGWKLPSVPFIQRLNQTFPVTKAADLPMAPLPLNAQGFYFTNLYNFVGSGNQSKTVATSLFSNRAKTSFSYGSKTNEEKAAYVVTTLLGFPLQVDLRTESTFTIVPVGTDYVRGPVLSVFKCHKK